MSLFVTHSETLNSLISEDYGMYPVFIKANIKKLLQVINKGFIKEYNIKFKGP